MAHVILSGPVDLNGEPMKPVDQATASDCLRACIASVFELPLDEVPYFGHAEEGTKRAGIEQDSDLREWLAERGLELQHVTNPDAVLEGGAKSAGMPWGYCVAGGKSPRGDWGHSIVYDWRDGTAKLAHDPHASRDGFDGAPTYFTCFLVKDPAVMERRLDRARDIAERDGADYGALSRKFMGLEVERDKLRNSRGCLLVGPGRGDCEHAVGWPETLTPDTTDVYGVPNDWCLPCYRGHQLEQMRAANDRQRAAVERVLADNETGEGWGPDVTMASVLRESLAPPDSTGSRRD